jgi:hypothetical protein
MDSSSIVELIGTLGDRGPAVLPDAVVDDRVGAIQRWLAGLKLEDRVADAGSLVENAGQVSLAVTLEESILGVVGVPADVLGGTIHGLIADVAILVVMDLRSLRILGDVIRASIGALLLVGVGVRRSIVRLTRVLGDMTRTSVRSGIGIVGDRRERRASIVAMVGATGILGDEGRAIMVRVLAVVNAGRAGRSHLLKTILRRQR